MNTEFSIFRVKKGKEERAEQWMRELSKRRSECVATLDREAMYYESVFKSRFGDRMYLAWYSIQGQLRGDVNESEHAIDKLHCAFWKECVDMELPPIDMEHVVSFAPVTLEKAIAKLDEENQGAKERAGVIGKL